MATNSTRSTALAVIPELPGCIPEVAEGDYQNYSDKALDTEIIESFGAAQRYYTGLRRELVLRLLPALAEMRQRHAAQGSRNDLNVRLGLPRKAGWEDYLRSRGLKPDTVRNWFQRHAGMQTLGLLVGATALRKPLSGAATNASTQPRLYRVKTADQILIVAASSAKRAMSVLHKGMFGLTDDASVEELGQVIEVQSGRIRQRKARQIDNGNTLPEKAILKALINSPKASTGEIAQRLGVSPVDVRRVATKHRGVLSKAEVV